MDGSALPTWHLSCRRKTSFRSKAPERGTWNPAMPRISEAIMSRDVAKPKLTGYEARQVEKIAAWKAEYPNPFGELFRRAAQPIAKVAEAVIPDQLAPGAINAAYKASELSATRSDIEIQAGVGDLSELRHRPMEVCDAPSRRVGTIAQGTAIVEGLTGAAGIWTTLLDVPLLFTLCLRTIISRPLLRLCPRSAHRQGLGPGRGDGALEHQGASESRVDGSAARDRGPAP